MSTIGTGETFSRAVASTDGLDKFLKLSGATAVAINTAISIIHEWGNAVERYFEHYNLGKAVEHLLDHKYEPLTNLAGEIKVANGFIGAFGIIKFAKEWFSGEWRKWSCEKIASRACLTPAKAIDSALFLNDMGLISLGEIAKGSVQYFPSLGQHCRVLPLGIAKDALVIASAGFSLWNSRKEAAAVDAQVNTLNRRQSKWENRDLDGWKNKGEKAGDYATQKRLFYARVQENEDGAAAICDEFINNLNTSNLSPDVKEKLSAFYAWYKNGFEEFQDKTFSDLHDLRVEKKTNAWREKAQAAPELLKSNILWGRIYDVAKIVICGGAAIGAFFMVTSAVPYVLGMVALGLFTAGLDWNKHWMGIQKKAFLDKPVLV